MSFYGIRLAYNKEKGDHYVATRNIEAGQIVFTEKFAFASPLLIQMSDSNSRMEYISRCANWKCWKMVKRSTGYSCPDCNYSLYCDENCFKKVEIYHKKICDPKILEDHLALAALYFSLEIKTVALSLLPRATPPKVFKRKILEFAVQLLHKKFPNVDLEKLINDTTSLHFAGFSMKTFIGGYNYANAFFLYASYFNHSCEPNCYYYFVGDEIHVRAMQNIPQGSEVTIAYDPDILYTSKEFRLDSLNNHLGCECNCPRCNDMFKLFRDQILFSKNRGIKDNALVLKASAELTKEYKITADFHVLVTFAYHYDEFFEPTHSIAYELFKKYGTHLWETSQLNHGIYFLKKLLTSVTKWEEHGINTIMLKEWLKVLWFLMICYKAYFETVETNDLTMSEIGKISLHMLDCHSAIQKWFDWRVMEVDEYLYPLLKQSIDLAKNCHEIIIENSTIESIINTKPGLLIAIKK